MTGEGYIVHLSSSFYISHNDELLNTAYNQVGSKLYSCKEQRGVVVYVIPDSEKKKIIISLASKWQIEPKESLI